MLMHNKISSVEYFDPIKMNFYWYSLIVNSQGCSPAFHSVTTFFLSMLKEKQLLFSKTRSLIEIVKSTPFFILIK